MAQRRREPKLDTRNARERLMPAGKPYYRSLRQGLHLGYRKGLSGGRWVARVYVGGGRYVVSTLAHSDDAVAANGEDVLNYGQALRAAEAAQARLASPARRLGPYTVADALDDYLQRLDQEGRPTNDTRSRERLHIRPQLGPISVADLSADTLRRWLRDLASKPARSPTGVAHTADRRDVTEEESRRRRSSANRTFTVLKAALNLAWREGRVADDKPWRSVRAFQAVDAARVRYLQIDEARRLLNACEPGFKALVHAALQTGCRYGELRSLLVHDFNKDAGTLHIRRSKSGKARHVILTDEGQQFFHQLCLGRPGGEVMIRNLARLERASALRGTGPDDGLWRPSEQVRAMAAASAAAKLKPPANFHSLRHTWASHSVMAGVPLIVVARNLGHSDTRMVERHYGHLADDFVSEAIRRGAPRFVQVAQSNVVAHVAP